MSTLSDEERNLAVAEIMEPHRLDDGVGHRWEPDTSKEGVAATAAMFGISVTARNVVAISFRQSMTPDLLRGRVASVSRMLAWVSQPVGALLGGLLAARFELRAPFLVAAVASLVMLIMTAPIISNRRIAVMRSDAAEA